MIEVKDLNDVPEKYRADYIEVEKDGVKIFQHKDFLTVIGAMKRKGEERDTLANELKSYKTKEAERVAEAEKKALEKLKAEGKIIVRGRRSTVAGSLVLWFLWKSTSGGISLSIGSTLLKLILSGVPIL